MGTTEDGVASPFMCGVEKPITFHYDWENEDTLSTSIVRQMVENAQRDATGLPESLYGCIDPDALEDLFRPLMDGTPRTNGEVTFSLAGHYVTARSDGTIEIESELGRLKRCGGNLLLTGDVPTDVFEELSVQFLGEPGYDRTNLFALYGRDTDVAETRLERANANLGQARILTHEAAVRSATQAGTGDSSNDLPVSPVVGSLDDFQSAILDEIFELQYQHKGFEPGQLRFCFDSLQLLSNEEEEMAVQESIRTITETVEEVSGLGQYVFPGAYESAPIRAVEEVFDVTIELKVGEEGPTQRWHLHDTEYTTAWFPL